MTSASKKSLIKIRKPVMHGENIMFIQESSSDSSAGNPINYFSSYYLPQEHAKPRIKNLQKGSASRSTDLTIEPPEPLVSNTSIASSLNRFRGDFETFKCKARVFGESLTLCRCMANDFKTRLERMEKRLESLEKRQKLYKRSSNYSVIIQKNKLLSYKTKKDVQKLQMCGTEEEMKEIAGRICRNYLHGAWKTIDPKELNCNRISGGLSNFLYYVALPDDPTKWGTQQKRESYHEYENESAENLESKSVRKPDVKCSSFTSLEEPKKVLLRIYGQVHGERAMDAIVTESVIFTLLSERRLGPRLHGVFSGGRIEEYIPARCLVTKELADPSLSMKIAEKMAAIHSMDVPLNKEPNWIWKTMYKWLKTVKEERLAGEIQGKNEEEERIIKQLKNTDFEKELDWLKKFLATVESPVVFCHNDMQEGNILLVEDSPTIAHEDEVSTLYVRSFESDEERKKEEEQKERCDYEDANTCDTVLSHMSDLGEPKLVLIDFEYCAYNHRGFDIANHFQEWAFDYTNPEHPFYYENQDFTPSLEQKEIFIREYLKHFQSNAQGTVDVTLDDVNKLLDEVEAFACASHLFWALWSIVNASKSQIPFGYWEYGLSRLDIYLRLKQEVIKKDKHGLPQKRKICEVDI